MKESGAQFVTIPGRTGMQLLCVYKWDFKDRVCMDVFHLCMHKLIIYNCAPQDATALRGSYFGDGDGPYHLSGVSCHGNESTLLECSHSGTIGYHTCIPGHDVGVICDGI